MTAANAPSTSSAKAITPSTRATLIVRLPADAKLTVNDEPTALTSATRNFVSPELTPGKAYQYTLKGEILRDGKKIESIKKVTVRAGEQTLAVLEFPAVSVAEGDRTQGAR